MGNPRDPRPAVKVGVLLPPPQTDLRRWLADAAAFDAAGADALWIDTGDHEGLDPLALTAALAALTDRSLLVTPAPPDPDDRTIATLEWLSRGRLAVSGDPGPVAGRLGPPVFRPLAGGGFVREAPGGEPERWVPAAWLAGRAAWHAAVAEAAGSGAAGLLIPAGPPLLDILRNPHNPVDRGDLQIAQG